MDRHGLQSSKSLSLSLSRQDNAAAQPHKRQNESVDEHEAVVETEPQAEPSQSTDPSCCSTRGSPLQQLWTGTGLQHATPRLSTQAPCPGPGDGSYLHPRNSPPVEGVNLGWLPYAHRAALALLCSRLFHVHRPDQCRRDGGCHVTPVHLHSQGDGMFPQVNTPNTFPAPDTVLLAALPSSSLFSPPQISAKTRSTLKQ